MGNSESHSQMSGMSEKVKETVAANKPLEIKMQGPIDSFEFRVHALDKVTSDQKPVSMWHDIKLFPTEEAKGFNVVNMVNEVSIKVLRRNVSHHTYNMQQMRCLSERRWDEQHYVATGTRPTVHHIMYPDTTTSRHHDIKCHPTASRVSCRGSRLKSTVRNGVINRSSAP